MQEDSDELASPKSVELAGIGQPARWEVENEESEGQQEDARGQDSMSRRYKGVREAARADCGTGPGWHGPEFRKHGLEGVVQVAKKPRGVRRLRGRVLATCN